MKKLQFIALVVLALGFYFTFQIVYGRGVYAGYEKMSTRYQQSYAVCQETSTFGATNWDISCDDGYIYDRVDDL